jgi:S1-C subfamily serine protease
VNILDLLLILAAIGFAVSGYRQGFVVGFLSVLGFVGGGVLAVSLLPLVLDRMEAGTTASVVAVVSVIVLASLGQALTTHFGNKLRDHLTGLRGVSVVDAIGGALINVLSVLVVAWLLGSALAGTSLPTVSKEVRSSVILGKVQRAMPNEASSWVAGLGRTLAANGFPQVFQPFQNEQITDVPPPDPKLASSQAVQRAKGKIVKITGTASGCGKMLEGTGFVYAPNRVMTNAHVVGGVDEPTVQISGEGKLLDAEVVLYDWRRDIAVLEVPGLNVKPLEFAERDARVQDGAIVAGFPENGGFDVRPARVRGRINAAGPDIYQRGNVTRDVYSLYATVRQGNSGGPLLNTAGDVVGVIFAKSLDDDSTGYALTLDEIQEDIRAGKRSTEPVDTQNCAL